MSDILPFLKELIFAPGISGREAPVARLIAKKWEPLTSELHWSNLGSLHGLRTGEGPSPRPSVMIAAHMDSIGLMVTGIWDGFLHITNVGGIDLRVLPGQIVTVYAGGEEDHRELAGVIGQPSAQLLPGDVGGDFVPLEHLLLDVGLPAKKISEWVRVGDMVVFSAPPVELGGDTLAGPALDNRASVAALTVCLEELQTRQHDWDVWAAATAQEEFGYKGAYTSAFTLHPSLAIVIDVSYARGPGSSDWNTYPLGKGPTLMWGPNIHPAMYKAFKELADKLEIPHSVEVTPHHTGTDAYAIQITGEGIPCMAIGIPLRYMHTPVEMVSLKDIQRTGRLVAEFISLLKSDFLQQFSREISL